MSSLEYQSVETLQTRDYDENDANNQLGSLYFQVTYGREIYLPTVFKYKVISYWGDRVVEHTIITLEPLDLATIGTNHHTPVQFFPIMIKHVVGHVNNRDISKIEANNHIFVMGIQRLLTALSTLRPFPAKGDLFSGNNGFALDYSHSTMSPAQTLVEVVNRIIETNTHSLYAAWGPYDVYPPMQPGQVKADIDRWLLANRNIINGFALNSIETAESLIDSIAGSLPATDMFFDYIDRWIENISSSNSNSRLCPVLLPVKGNFDHALTYGFPEIVASVAVRQDEFVDPFTNFLIHNQHTQLISTQLNMFVSNDYHSHIFYPIKLALEREITWLSTSGTHLVDHFTIREIIDTINFVAYTDMYLEVQITGQPAIGYPNYQIVGCQINNRYTTGTLFLGAQTINVPSSIPHNLVQLAAAYYPEATRIIMIYSWLDEIIISFPEYKETVYIDLSLFPLVSPVLVNRSVFNELIKYINIPEYC